MFRGLLFEPRALNQCSLLVRTCPIIVDVGTAAHTLRYTIPRGLLCVLASWRET